MKKKKFILCGEDDTDDQLFFRNAIALLFPEQECELKFAGNGIQVMAELENTEQPDILFLDLNMPQKNGLQCLSEIRNNSRYNNLPVIMLSTSANPGDIKLALDLGANLYAVKPMDFDALLQILGNCMKKNLNTTEKPAIDNFVLK